MNGMSQRFRFTTRRLLLVTAVLAVWVAVFVNGYQTLPSDPSNRLVRLLVWLLSWAALLCTFLIPAALAAIIVRALGKRSILAACCGAAIFLAFVAYVSFATWG